MRDKRVTVICFKNLGSAGPGRIDIAIVLERKRGLGGRKFSGLLGECPAALRGGFAFVPFHLQLLARRVCLPPGIGNDSNAAFQAGLVLNARGELYFAFNEEGVADAGKRFDLVEIRANRLTAKDRTFLQDGIEHARRCEINAEDGLAGDNVRNVDAEGARTDDVKIFAVFQLDFREVRRRKGRSFARQFSVAE